MKKISITLTTVLLTATAFAQSDHLLQSPKGIFIPTGREVPYDFTYRISRQEKNAKIFTVVEQIKAPATKEEYISRIHKFQNIFPQLPSPSPKQIDQVWKQLAKKKSRDSLFIRHPVIENLSLGLALLDSVVKGNKYKYQIEKIKNNETIGSTESKEIIFDPPKEISLPTAVFHNHTFINETLYLKWVLRDRAGIAGFEIHRRDNLKGTFYPVKILVGYTRGMDSTFVHVNDTLARRYEVYEYKIRPYDALGNPGAFTDITKVNTFTQDDLPFLKRFKAVAQNNREIKLSWVMDYKPFIRSIKIMRSESFDSAFVTISEVSPRDSTYKDVLPKSMENYYYRLVINGPDGVSFPTSSTFVLYQSDLKPEAVQHIKARPSQGGVEISWEDKQRNVFGYYIFRREKNENFNQVSEPVLLNPNGKYHYVDSLNLRGDRTYGYVVKTISDSYVLSQFSDTATVRPDIKVPINVPQNLRGRKADNKVYLFWDDLTDQNLMGYKIFRKKTGEKEFNALHDSLLYAGTNHFIDSAIEKGYAYDYAVKAYNYFGSESDLSNPIQFKFYLNLPTPPPSVKAHKVREGIRIVWGEVLTNDLGSFHLYKYSPGKKPIRITTVPADRHDFLDAKVERGQLYFYYVTSSNKQEIEGRPSEAVTARF